ncbi:MAG: hypothetical protein Q8880_06125 [Bacteroidota bacterium]|nr:hypothetical protein [Bacteroidota bacterium]
MKLLPVFLIIIFLQVVNAQGQVYRIDKRERPLLVLIEHNPFIRFENSNAPTFIAYESGLVIYKKKTGNRCYFYKAVLDSIELKNFFKELKLNEDSLYKLPKFVELNSKKTAYISDITTNELIIYTKDSTKYISALGNPFTTEFNNTTPKFLYNIIQKLKNYINEYSIKWEPQKFEVRLWINSESTDEYVEWPSNWPDIFSKDAINIKDMPEPDHYTITLDYKYFKKLNELINKNGKQRSVLLNNKKWAVSYRLKYPGTTNWW